MEEFKISADQMAKIQKWQNKIKKKYGEYGLYSFTFTPTGVGVGLTVFSYLANKQKDFTDYDLW